MGLQEAGLGAGRMMGSVWGVVSVQGPWCMWEELSRGNHKSITLFSGAMFKLSTSLLLPARGEEEGAWD